MKKSVAFVFLVIFIFMQTGCSRTYPVSSADMGTNATGFVTEIENNVVFYNEVEFVPEGTDRAKELGIENTDNGYEIYDPDAEIKTVEIATNVEFCLQRWVEENNAFGPVAVSREEFLLELENRSPDGILCTMVLATPSAPTESGQRQIVSELIEHYVP